jgi:hypothetical protein
VTGRTDKTVSPGNTARLAARLRATRSDVTEIVYPRVGHLSIIGAFAPVLRFLAPLLRDIDIFVGRVTAQSAAGP